MIDPVLRDAETKMTKSVDHFAGELATIRTGRANPALIDKFDDLPGRKKPEEMEAEPEPLPPVQGEVPLPRFRRSPRRRRGMGLPQAGCVADRYPFLTLGLPGPPPHRDHHGRQRPLGP